MVFSMRKCKVGGAYSSQSETAQLRLNLDVLHCQAHLAEPATLGAAAPTRFPVGENGGKE